MRGQENVSIILRIEKFSFLDRNCFSFLLKVEQSDREFKILGCEYMKQFKLIGVMLILGILGCKDKTVVPDQVLGVRYANYDQWIYKEPGSKKKEDQVALVYGFEEVTALESKEISIKEGKEEKKEIYVKLKTVDNKEGYALASNFSEAIFFIVDGNTDAFLKPTLTSGTRGKVSRASYCLLKETIGTFSKVDCKESVLQPNAPKLNDYYNVWIEKKETNVSNDPLLGETTKILRRASSDILKIRTMGQVDESTKLVETNTKELQKALEKNDIFVEDVNSLIQQYSTLFASE